MADRTALVVAAALVLAACTSRPLPSDTSDVAGFAERARSYVQTQRLRDRTACARHHGSDGASLELCLAERAEARRERFEKLLQELQQLRRRRDPGDGPAMCVDPVLGRISRCLEAAA